MFSITVALPLSAGRMVMLVFCFKFFSAALSVLVKLSLGFEEFLMIPPKRKQTNCWFRYNGISER